ncbi:MAG: hypothetical protein AAGC67_15620 [Myxococcota bacterium]
MTCAQPDPASVSFLDDPLAVHGRPVDHPRTAGFVEHMHLSEFRLAAPWSRVWAWLETPETFSEGQIWPYRVDFLAPDETSPAGFYEGGLNIHHGPLLSLPGRLDKIEETDRGGYRSLSYLYGSYVLSLRLIRPTRLEFWAQSEGEARTLVRLRLSSDVRPSIQAPWSRLQEIFWGRLARWMGGAIGAERID